MRGKQPASNARKPANKERTPETVKTKPAAKSKRPAGKLKDIKPRKNPKGGDSQTTAQRSRVDSFTVTFGGSL